MGERSWRGHWWAADDPNTRVPGILHCSEEGRLTLELVGGFDITVREPFADGGGYTVSAESRDVPIIHGISGGEKFTLLENGATHTSGAGLFRNEIVQQNWSSGRALRGIYLNDLESPLFVRGHLRLERLLHWGNETTFGLEMGLGEGEGPREARAVTRSVEPVDATHEGMRISLRILSTRFSYEHVIAANERALTAKEYAVLTFTPLQPAPCMAFDEVEKDMQDLLTLSTYEPCGAVNRSIVFLGDDGEPREVEVLGPQIYRTSDPRKGKDLDFLLTLANVEFAELIPAWLSLKEKARTGCNILFGLRYINKGYVGTRLLGVATAAESIHSALRATSTPLPKAQYRRIKKKLVAAIEDEGDYVINFVKMGLRNSPTYNSRMIELASIPDGAAVDSLLSDRVLWAQMLKGARNDLAHANERSSQGEEISRAFWLLEVTYALLCLVLLAELGVSPEIQRAAVARNSKINYASRQFRKILAGDVGREGV
ncbi:ApeA N-terminal domain 1-containing protein [Actinacidiphila glaucinigra]|uniref:ApeA N-terminal domain 1-containing protein n=1 Tax=Actinacidiphila glaucinigra TaxID=235986 RepID=UPI003673623C